MMTNEDQVLYDQIAERVTENEDGEILWNAMVQYGHQIKHWNPYVIVVNRKDKTFLMTW